jgi:putative phosphoribosyl transferase
MATSLLRYKNERPVVLGLPRGGVPIAYEIARGLAAPLDVMVVRKLGAPHQPELGIGAVVDGDEPQRVREVLESLHVSRQYLKTEIARQLEKIHRRQALLRAGCSRVDLADRTVIVVDDGMATGSMVRAALRGVRRANPRRIVLAVGVGRRRGRSNPSGPRWTTSCAFSRRQTSRRWASSTGTSVRYPTARSSRCSAR